MSSPWPQPTQPPPPPLPLDSRANIDPAWADVEWDYEQDERGEGGSSSSNTSRSSRRRTEDRLRRRHPHPSPPSPAPTPPPTIPEHLRPRQTIADQAAVAAARQQCQVFSGNDVISCFPTAGDTFAQDQWVTFIWNSRRPQLTQTNRVNIYLLRADSGEVVFQRLNQVNPTDQPGSVRGMVDDAWFGKQGFDWNGKNVSFPFQWAITRSDQVLDSNVSLQPIFTAVQTTVLSAVAAAQSSASVASASSAAAASLSSASAASASAASASSASATRSGGGTSTTGGPGGGNVQHASSASSFPRWAIAVIVVLGFLAIAASCILAFLILRRLRRRREAASRQGSRSSMGSASPMILADGQPGGGRGDDRGDRGGGQMSQRYTDDTGAPLLPPPSLAGGAIGHSPSHGHHSQYSGGAGGGGAVSYDGASTISDSGGPFSGADAAIMADAFRKMLRKPDFAGQIEEGESPGTDATTAEGLGAGAVAGGLAGAASSSNANVNRLSADGGPGAGTRGSSDERAVQREGVLSRELAEEGRDIRSVSSSRGVRVERMDDHYDS